ncbi:MAG: hypothetical protein WAS21_07325 [Geminicoccaceae bacterium]
MRWNRLVPGSFAILAGCAGIAGSGTGEPPCAIGVASGPELAAALARPGCGVRIVLADGSYQGDFVLRNPCPVDLPITVQAEHPLAAVLQSRLVVTGNQTTIRGLRFEGPDAGVTLGGTGNRLIGNVFTGWRGVAVRLTAGTGAEIAYNEFAEPASWSLGGDQRQGISSNEPNGGLHLNAWVHHDHFHDFPAKPQASAYASGQSDALEICGGGQPASDRRSGWTIENNLIERHYGGYGIVDIKCDGTVARNNTILASPGGRIDLRQGSYSVLAGNWIEDAGGSVIHGGHHQVLGNHLAELNDGGYPDLLVGLILTAGTVPWDYTGLPRLPDGTPAHQAAFGVVVSGNTAPSLEIGPQRRSTFSYPVHGTVIEQQTGPIHYGLAQATTVAARASRPIPLAIRLDPESVGLNAAPGLPADNPTRACSSGTDRGP